MTELQKRYFHLLQVGLRTGCPAAVDFSCPDDWQGLYDLAVRQGTDAFVWDALSELQLLQQVPLSLRMQWAFNVERIEKRYLKQREALGELALFLAQHAIPLMVLKGFGISLCYPRPDHRPCGDIDIWLYGHQQEADDLLRKELGIEIDEDKHHHTVFYFQEVMVENHYDFLNVHAHASNREIERLLWEYASFPGEKVVLGAVAVTIPSPRFNALFLLRHAAAHFAAEAIGIRHVADWAMFVQRYGNQIDWTELYATARRMNMHRFLYCLNAIAIDCLGVDAACIAPFERDPQLEKRVLDEILSPQFAEKSPKKGFVRVVYFKFRRWMANRWKHRIVYREGLVSTFFRQVYSHLLKPQSIAH